MFTDQKDQKPGQSPHWEWLGDDGRWIRYSVAHTHKLTAAMEKGEEEVVVRVAPGVKMAVRFASMTQTNMSTGWQRDIRCTLDESAGAIGKWERQLSDGKWAGFGESASRQLTAARLCEMEKVIVEVGSKKCTVDMMELKCKEEGEEARCLRCVPADTATTSGNMTP